MVALLLTVLLVRGDTKKILQFPKTKVIAFDRDQKSKLIADKLKKNLKTGLNFLIKNLVKLILLEPQIRFEA